MARGSLNAASDHPVISGNMMRILDIANGRKVAQDRAYLARARRSIFDDLYVELERRFGRTSWWIR
jgi:hypothetical protein